MRASKLAAKKYKRVYEYFPNLAILTKSAILVEIQVIYGHASVGDKPLGETVTNFTILVLLEAPNVVSMTKVFLRAAITTSQSMIISATVRH